jgi:hypothetical protein
MSEPHSWVFAGQTAVGTTQLHPDCADQHVRDHSPADLDDLWVHFYKREVSQY